MVRDSEEQDRREPRTLTEQQQAKVTGVSIMRVLLRRN